MKILSITLEKCSGCAVLIDDKIVFSTSEERYSRIKSDSSFPKNSINDDAGFWDTFGNKMFAFLTNVFFGGNCTDSLNGSRIIYRKLK